MNKNHLHLLDRIRNLSVSIIENMSSDAMAMMTDGFNESLVRNVLYVGKTNREQRKIIKCIKDNYKCWKKETEMFWGTLPQLEVYPDFILELQMDIECGMVVTVERLRREATPCFMPPTRIAFTTCSPRAFALKVGDSRRIRISKLLKSGLGKADLAWS